MARRNTNKVHVCFTMDVERTRQYSPGGGPSDLEASGRALASYSSCLESLGYRATFFVVPFAAMENKGLLRDLASRGHEIGLHFHANSWKDNYSAPTIHPLGAQPVPVQREWLSESKVIFEEVIGAPPRCFRGGYFSASSDTYEILLELGIKCGSTSMPGRQSVKFHAFWRGAAREIHTVGENTYDGFIDVPVTSKLDWRGRVARDGDVRLERLRSPGQLVAAVQQTIDAQEESGAPIKHICILTHNTREFGGVAGTEGHFKGIDLGSVIDQLQVDLKTWGYEVIPATVSRVATAFRTTLKSVKT